MPGPSATPTRRSDALDVLVYSFQLSGLKKAASTIEEHRARSSFFASSSHRTLASESTISSSPKLVFTMACRTPSTGPKVNHVELGWRCELCMARHVGDRALWAVGGARPRVPGTKCHM